MLLPDLIVLDTPTFASSTPLAARRRKIEDEHWSPSPLPKRKSPRHTVSVVAAVLPKVQQPQLQPEFSPASEAKLEGFKRALRNKEHVWCSWIDKESGHVKSKGLIDASESLVLPLQLTGDRDTQVKPQFTMIVEMMGKRSFSFLLFSFLFSYFLSFLLHSRLATQKGFAQHPAKQLHQLPASLFEAQAGRAHEGGLQRDQDTTQAREEV